MLYNGLIERLHFDFVAKWAKLEMVFTKQSKKNFSLKKENVGRHAWKNTETEMFFFFLNCLDDTTILSIYTPVANGLFRNFANEIIHTNIIQSGKTEEKKNISFLHKNWHRLLLKFLWSYECRENCAEKKVDGQQTQFSLSRSLNNFVSILENSCSDKYTKCNTQNRI